MQSPPAAQGLYDPANEHDACGIGAVVNISGKADHRIVEYARQILLNLMHRGAAGADETTGDGAGILMQLPDALLRDEANRLKFALPAPGRYGAAMVFGPRDSHLRARCEALLVDAIDHCGMRLVGWRNVPCDPACLGKLALASEPIVRQAFIDGCGLSGEDLERRLYLARKRAERLVRERLGEQAVDFYICSMSCRTMVYKGMFMAPQLAGYYPDLSDKRMQTALAVVHQRYSTNTFPNWRLAQPFRIVAHNGEINTLSGNVNRMRAREMLMASPLLGEDLSDLRPVLVPGGSDSAMFDNALELLVRAGRSLPHAMMMMIPEAFGAAYHISTDKRAFYEYHAAIMEPWDGPAAMVFTDGRLIGGTLDRNGLRPARYVVTDDGLVVLASEAGVIEFPPERISQKGRLQPGRMFLVDTEQGRIVVDNEIKSSIARRQPYRRWLEQNRTELRGLFNAPSPVSSDSATIARRMRMFNYTAEELRMILAPMAANGQEPVGSMGTDTPLAVLSDQPKSVFGYFQQLFAQVTNPPIDPYREGLVMSLMAYAGKQRNLLEETPAHARQLRLPHPVLTNDDIVLLRSAHRHDFRVATVDALFDVPAERSPDADARALKDGMDRLIAAAEAAVRGGASMIIISDRNADDRRAPIPALLATAGVHHGLLDKLLRAETGLVVESGEPREVMHFCLLCGFGANAVNPYLALESLDELRRRGDLPQGVEAAQFIDNYVTAVKKGILKVMSKMGISTLRSYFAAQLFEAIGLGREVIDAYFKGVSSRVGGVGLDVIARDVLSWHASAFSPRRPGELEMDYGGEYHYRRDGEHHLWNPTTIAKLHHAVRNGDQAAYDEYARAVNDQSRRIGTLRGLFELVGSKPVPLDQVEPAENIVKRFCTGAMSHGSISREAHEALCVAMNRLGGMSNTGEGGEDEARYAPDVAAELNSAIKQVASGRFGVTINYLAHARELQIKMAQGAKPGEGGQLAGLKVTEEIARLRHSTPGVTLISPPPHHDIYSIEDLAQLIYDLKCSNPGVKVSVKLVSELGVGTIAAGVAKGNADEVLISGYDGGTGNSPLSSIKHAGTPWELGLAETQQTLVLNGLRDRIRVQTDGQLKTGRDVVVAALLGAEQFGFGTAALVSLGCVMMRKCHLGACPAGVATQDPSLRSRFAGKPEHLQRFMMFVANEVRQIMAELGFRKFEDMIGRVDRLSMRGAIEHYKARGLDLSAVLRAPEVSDGRALRQVRRQGDPLRDHLDWQLVEQAKTVLALRSEGVPPSCIAGVSPAKDRDNSRTAGKMPALQETAAGCSEGVPPSCTAGVPPAKDRDNSRTEGKMPSIHAGKMPALQEMAAGCSEGAETPVLRETPVLPSSRVKIEGAVRNVHRTVGAILSNRIIKACGPQGLPDGTIDITLTGSAGQSFGAWLAPGVTLRLVGEANDYLGKGLSGGRIVVQAPPGSRFPTHENIIVGNTLLYGATSGEVFINGLAGERFAVRNSGATAVVEGVGDHGCEYMTGGTVIVLGRTGRNFAAGMSGGVAYVLDEQQLFDTLCNLDMVDLETVWHEEDRRVLHELITRHFEWTGSLQAKRLLGAWHDTVGRFVKVMPIDYRKALAKLREREHRQSENPAATEEVYRG